MSNSTNDLHLSLTSQIVAVKYCQLLKWHDCSLTTNNKICSGHSSRFKAMLIGGTIKNRSVLNLRYN